MKKIIVKNQKHLEKLAKRKNQDFVAVINKGNWKINQPVGDIVDATSGSIVHAYSGSRVHANSGI